MQEKKRIRICGKERGSWGWLPFLEYLYAKRDLHCLNLIHTGMNYESGHTLPHTVF